MRTKFLLSLALLMLPCTFMVGCDSSENQTGTGMKEPPPDVKAEIERRNKQYEEQMKKQQENPTPSDGQQVPAPQ